MRTRVFFFLAATAWLMGLVAASAATPEQVEFFERRIRPLLAQECYDCHSTAGQQKGGLVLDHREGLLKGGDSGPSVIPGQPDSSLLLQAIRHEHKSLKMPRNGAKFEDHVLADFARWIAEGAADPRDTPPSPAQLAKETDWMGVLERRKDWWSLHPVSRPEPPAVAEPEWAESPVDAFLRAKAADSGLGMAGEADRRTLIRRASYVLTGLPPSPAEVEAFVRDESPEAWRALVDRLLASPAFGERWARHWMDWVRYAETHGSEGDPPIPHAWRYRDYLVRAWNADVPYPQLVREAVAGDLLPSPRLNTALGLNESALGAAQLRFVLHGFTPTDALDEQVTFIENQIDTLSKAFMGMTVACARCHNHKFDAISQTDFYAMYGILAGGRPALLDVNTPERRGQRVEELADRQTKLREKLAEEWLAAAERLPLKLSEWEPAGEREKLACGDGLRPLSFWLENREAGPEALAQAWGKGKARWADISAKREAWRNAEAWNRWDLSQPEDVAGWTLEGPGLAQGPDNGAVVASTEEGAAAPGRIAAPGRSSDALSGHHRGVLQSPAFDGKGGTLWLRVAGQGGAAARYVVRNYPRSGTVYPITRLDKPESAQPRWISWNMDYWKGDRMHLEVTTAADQPVQASAEEELSWFTVQGAVYPKDSSVEPPPEASPLFAMLDDKDTPGDGAALAARYADAARRAIRLWRDGRADDDATAFLNALLENGLLPLELPSPAKSALAEYAKAAREVPQATRIAGLIDADTGDRALFVRGDHHQPAALVPRRFLEALDARPYEIADGASGRLELARSLSDESSPLLARVIVNRLWHHVFGRGIVATTDNFGRLGEAPTHPELLDWLATDFLSHGGSMKHTLRELLLSRAFRLEHHASPAAVEKDPGNLLRTHWSPRRLEAEAVRDTLLSLSGTLDLTPGGPPVGSREPRRSLYVRVVRNNLDPFLTVFDAPVPSGTRGVRDATNVPDQALTMMNNPLVLNSARQWAERVQKEAPDEEARVRRFFVEGLGREASGAEVEGSVAFLREMERIADETRTREADLRRRLDRTMALQRELLAPLRDEAATQADEDAALAARAARPLWEWDFGAALSGGEKDGTRPYGPFSTPLELHGGARVADGSLWLDGREAYASSPLLGQPLREKTLEAWVKLDGLEQRGGGVISLQTPNGATFDAIVIGEQQTGEWITGSNNFKRTKALEGTREDGASGRFVHVAATYAADGMVTFYRQGQPYGKPYQAGEVAAYEPGKANVALGLRHAPAGGNRLLAGAIARARLYDRALKADEIALTSRLEAGGPTDEDLALKLGAEDKARLRSLARERDALDTELKTLAEELRTTGGEGAAWTALAHSLMNLKELIYLR